MTKNLLASPAFNRRALLKMMGAAPTAAAASSLFAGRAFAATDELNIYSWPNYFAALSLDGWAEQSGVTPSVSTYDSNDTMFAKLNSPAGEGFDIAVPSQSWIPQMAERGLIEEIDHSRIDLSGLNPGLLDREFDPGNRYSIPKDYGFMGVIYDPEACGMEIVTWEDFLTAGAKPEVSGRVRMSGSGWETVGVELWLTGVDWNTATNEQIETAGQRLIEFAPHVRSFSGLDVNSLVNGSIVLAQTNQGTARAAMALNPKLKWVLPGPFTELWVDNYAIVKGAPNIDNAYDFLSYQLQEEVQIAATEFIGFPAALDGLIDKLPDDIENVEIIFGGEDVDYDMLTSFIVNPDTIGTYMRVQSEIQAASA